MDAGPTITMAPGAPHVENPGGWPTPAALRVYLKMYLGLHLLFVTVYGGANWLAARHPQPWHYYGLWEREVPFVPAMMYVYMSIALVFLVPLFVLGETRLRHLGRAATACILIAGLFFVLVPGTTAFALTPAMPAAGTLEASLFHTLHVLDQPYNTAPSLHVALTTLFVMTARHATKRALLRALLLGWLGAIMVSVVLVHQHHLADVATGVLLGAGCYALYRRWTRSV